MRQQQILHLGHCAMATRTIFLFAVLLLPLAAADYTPGTAVDKKDYDFFPTPSMRAAALCYLDVDGSQTIGINEALFIKYKTNTCGSASGKDIRLNFEDGTPGPSRVDTDDPAYGKALTAVPAHAVRYVDLDGDGKLKKKDVLYLDIAGLTGSVVDPGDFRLMDGPGGPAFSFVKGLDADLTFPLRELKGAAGDEVGADNVNDAQLGENGVLFEAGKAFYINADTSAADTAIEEGDLRLGSVPTPWALPDFGAPALEIVEQTTSNHDGLRLITVVVKNVDDVTGAGLLETSVGGLVVDARGTPTLAPGEQVRMIVVLPLDGDVAVQVSDEDGFQTFGGSPPEKGAPGVGGILVAGLLLAAFVLRRGH